MPVVCIVLLDNTGRVLLQRRTTDAAVAPGLWVFPGGHLEEGETTADAARRELHEETNVRVADLAALMEGVQEVQVKSGGVQKLAFSVFRTRLPEAAEIVVGEGDELRFVEIENLRDYRLGPIAARIAAELVARRTAN